jgi:hypothetical protein
MRSVKIAVDQYSSCLINTNQHTQSVLEQPVQHDETHPGVLWPEAQDPLRGVEVPRGSPII